MNCMLSDMGIARTCDCQLKTQIGTPSYTAPEVWKVALETENQNFAVYGYEVDAWSLGCVFYYMQTGQELFDGLYGSDQIEQFLKEKTFDDFDPFPALVMRNLITADKDQRKANWEALRQDLEIK